MEAIVHDHDVGAGTGRQRRPGRPVPRDDGRGRGREQQRLVADLARRMAVGLDWNGAGQAAAVAELLRAAGYAETDARRDLAGIERIVRGW